MPGPETSLRVLLAGEVIEGNVGWSFAAALRRMGHELEAVNEAEYLGYHPSSLLSRLARKLTGSMRRRGYNRALIGAAETFRPSLVLVLKGGAIEPATLERLRAESGALLVNYMLDDYFPLDRRAVSRELHAGIPLYDLIATTKRYNVEELRGAGAQRVEFVRSGYDPEVHHPLEATAEERERFGSDVLFVGTYEPDRAEMLEALVREGRVDVAVYGNGWQALPRSSPLYPYLKLRPLYGREKLAAFATCRLALCFLRKANRDTYTDRSFEIPACRAFMLAERTEEHRALFREGEEIACFESADELVEKVEYYLDHEEERRRVAEAGYARVGADRHTYADRLGELLELVRHTKEPTPFDYLTLPI